MKPHIITLSGPSLSGKTELSKMLQEQYKYNTVISVTTRPKRTQEVNGIDYHFITEQDYEKLNLIQKTNYNNFNYGVSKVEIMNKSEQPILWVIAPKSINQVENICKENDYLLTKIFVNNPEEVLFGRLFKRFREDILADVNTYVKRLEDMVSVEKKWITDASYDLIIPEFNENNKNDVLDNVVDFINKAKNTNKLKIK